MKKFFSFILTAMVMCAAVSMTSCSDDDDPVADKPETAESLKYYDGAVTKDVLTYFNINLVFSNETKTKEVNLTADMCKEDQLHTAGNFLEFIVSDIDGVRGVTSVKALVTPKENIEHMLAESKGDILVGVAGGLFKALYYPAKNEWDLTKPTTREFNVSDAEGMLGIAENGKPGYVNFCELASAALSTK